MELKYLGHSCFQIQFNGKTLLFDPFITGNPLAKEVRFDDICPDYILLSHGHGDHVMDAISIASRSKALIISTYEIVSWFEKQGISGIPMNTGGKKQFEFGWVKLVNAIHSSVLPDGTYGANPVGFCIYHENGCFYYAGDTALTMDMQLIPKICPPLDLAILPIGDHFTMGYEDAILAAQFVQCQQVVGCHFNTFPAIEIDIEKVRSAFEQAGLKITIPSINEQYSF